MITDTTNYDALADKAERGELKQGTTVYSGDGRTVNLEDMFVPAGRPRAEEQKALRTWKIRANPNLDDAARKQAEREGMPKSALVRKAVAYYLERECA